MNTIPSDAERALPDRKNTIALLKDWQLHHERISNLMDGITKTIGLDINGPMFDTVWKLFDAYTDALGMEVGDSGTWMGWFFSENAMGKKGLEAGYDNDLKPIRTLEDLADLIETARSRNE